MSPLADSPRPSEPLSVALIGSEGANAQRRVLPALRPFRDRLRLTKYDLKPVAEEDGIAGVQVRSLAELAERLHAQRPDVAVLETPDDTHADLIEVAAAAG